MRGDLGGQRPAGTDRHAENDEVGALNGFRGAVITLVDETELQRRIERLLGARAADDLLGETLAAHRVADRRANQADADQRHALEHRLAHAGRPPMKSASAETTARLSASVPMVTRRQSGRP